MTAAACPGGMGNFSSAAICGGSSDAFLQVLERSKPEEDDPVDPSSSLGDPSKRLLLFCDAAIDSSCPCSLAVDAIRFHTFADLSMCCFMRNTVEDIRQLMLLIIVCYFYKMPLECCFSTLKLKLKIIKKYTHTHCQLG